MSNYIDISKIPEEKKFSKNGKYYILYTEEEDRTIVRASDGKIVSRYFIDNGEKELNDLKSIDSTTHFKLCFKGPTIRLWTDDDRIPQLSIQNNEDCYNSFWGNNSEKFGPLFYNNGGNKFLEHIPLRSGTSHYFIILTKELMITGSWLHDLKDNDCVIVYIGTTNLKKERYELAFDENIFCYQTQSIYPDKFILNKRILYPLSLTHQVVNNLIKKINNPEFPEHLFYGDEVIMIKPDTSITKILCSASFNRNKVNGISRNAVFSLWCSFDKCYDRKNSTFNYEEEIPMLGVPNNEELQFLATDCRDPLLFVSKLINKKEIMNDRDSKIRNMLLYYILSSNRNKAQILIKGFFDYENFKKRLVIYIKQYGNIFDSGNFIELGFKNNEEIINFKERNNESIIRIKDIYTRARAYANSNKMGNYHYRFNSSITGFVNNEYCKSLYKIFKMIKFLENI